VVQSEFCRKPTSNDLDLPGIKPLRRNSFFLQVLSFFLSCWRIPNLKLIIAGTQAGDEHPIDHVRPGPRNGPKFIWGKKNSYSVILII